MVIVRWAVLLPSLDSSTRLAGSACAPIYYNVSDAVPTLTPFLQGGPGFIGPVAFPGVDAINAFLGDDQAVKVPPFVSVF